MSEPTTKFTPGPWHWYPQNLEEYDEPKGLSNETRYIIDPVDRYSGYPECGEDLRLDITQADRALIAAAPDMYEALQLALVTIASNTPFYVGEDREMADAVSAVADNMDRARAVISAALAKATPPEKA